MGSARENAAHFENASFAELDEEPHYFLKEVKLDSQLNFIELDNYIRDLTRSGFDTVIWACGTEKVLGPDLRLIRGDDLGPVRLPCRQPRRDGIGASIVAIAYMAIDKLFEQLGNVNHLTPIVAA